jgi:hypothetical protein
LESTTGIDWMTLLAIAGTATVTIFLLRRLMHGMNQQDWILLRQTRSRGIDIKKPQSVDFVVFAATQETADELARLMREAQFETSMTVAQIAYARKNKAGEAQDGWLVKGTRELLLTPEELIRQRKFLTEIAEARKAAYLGWQVGFAKDAKPVPAPLSSR